MKVLVLGGGGREHTLVWKIAQSPKLTKLYAAPGNPGMASMAECVDLAVDDIEGLLGFARENAIDLTVVGPEKPLALGIVDAFTDAGLTIFGPTREAAQLESSKVFAKTLMRELGVPTAGFTVFEDVEAANDFIRRRYDEGSQLVVKADGLAEGKGAIVTSTADEALDAVHRMLVEKDFGPAGERVVIEDRMQGEEASVFALCDGLDFVTLVSSQDHKRVFDNDEGPNTGGMGAYAPAPVMDDAGLRVVEDRIIRPMLAGMVERGTPFRGVLYVGVILVGADPYVIEFNCRFGDPEAQVVLPLMESDLLELLDQAARGGLQQVEYRNKPGAACCVVTASGGYPATYPKGFAIEGIEAAEATGNTVVFHAGTKRDGDQIVTNGGRVLGVTSWDKDLPSAIDRAYEAVGKIHFERMHYRKDIGAKGLARLG